MDPLVVVAIVGGLGTVVASLIAARTATQAERLKNQTSEIKEAVVAWKDLTAEHKADKVAERAEFDAELFRLKSIHTIEKSELNAIIEGQAKQIELQLEELRQLRKGSK